MSTSFYDENLTELYKMLDDVDGRIQRTRQERERLKKLSMCEADTRRRIMDEIGEQQRLKHKAEATLADDFKAKYGVSRVSSVITSSTLIDMPGVVELGTRTYTHVHTETEPDHVFCLYNERTTYMYQVNVHGLEDEVQKTKEIDDKAREHFRVAVESLKSIRDLSKVHFEEAIYRVTRTSSNNYLPVSTEYDDVSLLFDEVFGDVAEEVTGTP